MKIFSAIFVAAIIAITVGRCRAKFLLVKVDDGKGPRSNNDAKAHEIEELARQGICDIKPCCCDSCYPCDYEEIFGTKNLPEAKFNEKPQDPRGPSSCGNRGCGPPPCPTPCSRSPRSNATSRVLPTLNCLTSSRYICSPDLRFEEVATGAGFVQCPNTEEPERTGNYIQYHIKATSMAITGVCMENCGEPRPKQCHCNRMLDKLLARHTNVNEIVGIFSAENYMGGCRCYLGAAARAKFKFVQMDLPSSTSEFCEERKEISAKKRSPNYYVKVCETLHEQGCEGLPGKITKA